MRGSGKSKRHQPVAWAAGIGLALIGLGIVSLYLSYAIATGWWQGTSQALGVGFVVGGLVDVLAISGLSRITVAEDRRRQLVNDGLRRLLQSAADYPSPEAYHAALNKFLLENVSQLDELDSDLRPRFVLAEF